jgi:tetratricopeptide (TPR) repeat protein
MSGQKMNQALAQASVNVLKVYQLRMKKLSDEQILEKYDRLISVIDYGVANEKDQGKIDKWETIRAKADEMLIQLIKKITDCDFIKEVFVPKFEAEPTNLKYAQWIFKFMLMGKCTSEPVWMKATEVIYEDNKNAKLAEILGNKYLGDKDYTNAERFYNEGIELAINDNVQTAEFYVRLGHVKRARGANSSARDFYRKALTVNPADKEPYSFIGVLYSNSSAECAEKVNKAQDRLIFIAAYNMYKRAGDAKRMAGAKEQFPSKEEIFEVNWDKGSSRTVGCWINETVVLDTRD